MSFKRVQSLETYPQGEELTKKLIGIGFKIDGEGEKNPNIEDVLIAAATEGMNRDFRILSLLTDWFSIHHKYVNIDRLIRALKQTNNSRAKSYFSAIGKWLEKHNGFKKLSKIYRGEPVLLGLTKDYQFLIKRNGEDERFIESKLRVAKGTLRTRPEDILPQEELAKIHSDYYFRVLIGPSYRADMVSLFSRNSSLTASQLAKQTYGSFATAWDVMKDLSLIPIIIRR